MKLKILTIVILMPGLTIIGYSHATTTTANNRIIKIDDLKSTVEKEAIKILAKRGIHVKNLSKNLSHKLRMTIHTLTNQLTTNLNRQQKTDVALSIIQKDLEQALIDFIIETNSVVPHKILVRAVDTFIAQRAEAKSVNIKKLPENMQAEFTSRRNAIIRELTNSMSANGQDYVFVSELKNTCHQKLDLFWERAKYVQVSQWGQGAMEALNSLKFVTSTQPFPNAPYDKVNQDC